MGPVKKTAIDGFCPLPLIIKEIKRANSLLILCLFCLLVHAMSKFLKKKKIKKPTYDVVSIKKLLK